MLALLAQVFAFHAAWGTPPRPPPPPRPALFSPGRAVSEALWYCRDRGLTCRADGARLMRDHVWRVRLDVAQRRHRHPGGQMVLDLDAWSGAVLAVRDRPGWNWRWEGERWEHRDHRD